MPLLGYSSICLHSLCALIIGTITYIRLKELIGFAGLRGVCRRTHLFRSDPNLEFLKILRVRIKGEAQEEEAFRTK